MYPWIEWIKSLTYNIFCNISPKWRENNEGLKIPGFPHNNNKVRIFGQHFNNCFYNSYCTPWSEFDQLKVDTILIIHLDD